MPIEIFLWVGSSAGVSSDLPGIPHEIQGSGSEREPRSRYLYLDPRKLLGSLWTCFKGDIRAITFSYYGISQVKKQVINS